MSPCACSRLKQRPTFALAFFGSSAQKRNQRVFVSCARMSRMGITAQKMFTVHQALEQIGVELRHRIEPRARAARGILLRCGQTPQRLLALLRIIDRSQGIEVAGVGLQRDLAVWNR